MGEMASVAPGWTGGGGGGGQGRGGGGGGWEARRAFHIAVKEGRNDGSRNNEELNFQYRDWEGVEAREGRTARPAVSRRRRKA